MELWHQSWLTSEDQIQLMRFEWADLKQILQAFPLSSLPLPRFYFFALLFTSHRSPLSERLEKAIIFIVAKTFDRAFSLTRQF